MGNTPNSSSTSSQLLPEPIPLSKIQNPEENTVKYLIQCLCDRGFVIFSTHEGNNNYDTQFDLLYSGVKKFCSGTEMNLKQQYLDPKGENIGYIKIDDIREYLKLKQTNPIFENSTQPSLCTPFSTIFSLLLSTAWNSFLGIHSYLQKLHESNSKLKPILSDSDLPVMYQCVSEMSSLSMIHYYKTGANEPIYNVCDTHKDTGILTIIVCSDVSGLKVFDKMQDKFVDVESLVKSKDLIMIMGEKMPIFTGTRSFEATPHKVELLSNTERYSLVFLLDTAKS